MSAIPSAAQYDCKKAKVLCSIQWIISEAYCDENVPHYLSQKDIEQVFESDGGLKKNICYLLCSGEPYCKLIDRMFNMAEPIQCHEDVIQILCSKGLYLLNEADSLITADDLRKMPLVLEAHRIMMDMLMYAYVSHKFVSVNLLVKTVRKFSDLVASKELPDDLYEGLILWLSKASSKVHAIHRDTLESDKHTFGQQREDDTRFPTIENLAEDLRDGRALALLLHYYCPNHIPLGDIILKESMSVKDAWHNLQLGLDFCNDVVLSRNSPVSDFISPSVLCPADFLYCDGGMKHNVVMFFGTLFYHLEMEALQGVVSPLGHSVLCKRQRVESSETARDDSLLYETCCYLTPNASPSEEKHQQTFAHPGQVIPDVQPLLSDVTRQSFRKNDSTDLDSGSGTLDASGDRNASLPFSSKPLLVRRNRDQCLSSSSKRHMEAAYANRLPFLPNTRDELGVNYMSDDCDFPSTAVHPLRKSNSYQGLGHEPRFFDKQRTRINKWQLRTTPVSGFRNTNTSNNTHEDPRLFKTCPGPATSGSDTDLLSNVEIHNDVGGHNVSLNHIHLVPSVAHSTVQFQNLFCPKPGVIGAVDASDLTLETARTSDYLSSRSQGSCTTNSSATSDLTSVSPKTASSTVSSSETAHLDLPHSGRVGKGGVPLLVSTDGSPELPTNVTRVKPYRAPGSSTTTSIVTAPSSQKSYTVQDGEFKTVHSARTAGYPIIDASPELRQRARQPMRASHDLRTVYSSPTSGDRLSTNSTTQSTNNEEQMVIGGTVVKLRNLRSKSSRTSRYAKASSWMDDHKSKFTSQASEDHRRHSNVPDVEKMASVFKKLEERRKFIETERRRIEERKKFIEEEKRRKEREWMEEYSKLQQEIGVLDLQASAVDDAVPRSDNDATTQKSPQVTNPRTSKNEDTSSDYSSKSPSPSSMNNNNPGRLNPEMDVCSSNPDNLKFFASPLSTTTYLAAKSPRQPLNRSNHSGAGCQERASDQKQTFIVTTSPGDQSKPMLDQRTFDVPEAAASNPGGATVLSSSLAASYSTELPYAVTPRSSHSHRSQTGNPLNKKQSAPCQNATYDVTTAEAPSRGSLPRVDLPQTELAVTSQSMQSVANTIPSGTKVLQPLPSEHTSRRSLFSVGNHDCNLSTEQENIDPNHLVPGQRVNQTTYDSFSGKIAGMDSNQSTPHKFSPRLDAGVNATCVRVEDETAEEMPSVVIETKEEEKKVKGFEILDNATPNTEITKKRDRFLMNRLKKEEEMKRKKAGREEQEEKKREEARQKQEELAAKKEEANFKRQQILEQYKKKKQEQEEVKLAQQSSSIVSGVSGKKHSKSQSTPNSHGLKATKASNSARSSPVLGSGSSAGAKVNGTHSAGENRPTFRTRKLSASGRRDWDAESATSSAVSSDYLGPKLYKQPSSKSNKNIIHNAVCHCCLPGKVDEPVRNNTIEVLEMSESRHFMILFRDSKCQYRGLYSYNPETEKLHKLSGIGPTNIAPNMIESLYKYNSGRKAFTALPSKTLSVGIDAITIKNTLWQSSKRPNTSKK